MLLDLRSLVEATSEDTVGDVTSIGPVGTTSATATTTSVVRPSGGGGGFFVPSFVPRPIVLPEPEPIRRRAIARVASVARPGISHAATTTRPSRRAEAEALWLLGILDADDLELVS